MNEKKVFMKRNDKVAIIIPTFNRKTLLKSVLMLIGEQTIKPDYVIVINDGSSDGTEQMLNSVFPNVIQIKGDGNLWWTKSVNVGIKYVLDNLPDVKGIILQNDDVGLNNDWLEKLLRRVEDNPKSLVGCINVDSVDKKTITWAGKRMHTWFAISYYYYRGDDINDLSDIKTIESFDLIGRGIYIPVDVFGVVGLFDDKHFVQCGDPELPIRARLAGFNLIVATDAVVYDMVDETPKINIKKYYTSKDFKYLFFDFRSSAFWKYRYYYGKTVAKNRLQHMVFFTSRMILHLAKFIRKYRPFSQHI